MVFAGITIGIGEYSSANFFSDDTVNSPDFVLPARSQVEVRIEPDLQGRLRPYTYFRSGFGDQDYPLALASAMLPYVIDPLATPTQKALDAKVFQGYGTKLFPRSISYSAGLIDYFFRGSASGIGQCAPPGTSVGTVPLFPYTILVQGVGSLLSEDELADGGQLWAGVVYTESGGGEKHYLLSDPVAYSNTTTAQYIDFRFSSGVPSNWDSFGNFILYKGRLGQEDGAVAVGPAPSVC